MTNENASAALARTIRDERARILATLVRRYGMDLAEESLDIAVESALRQWPAEGVPASPRAWLLEVARRRAVDVVRHNAMSRAVHGDLRAMSDERAEPEDPFAVPDDRLRLVFTCCHPALARESQVALALRWLSGLSTEDVARAFCVPAATMAQRLTRAKSKIALARIAYEVPERSELPERLGGALEVIYAIFNEGYVATAGDSLQRIDLAEEALRLAELMVALMPEHAEPRALLSLILLVHARRDARTTADGALVPLASQDRARWDRAAIDRGRATLAAALASGPPSAYAIEAAIQALHDESPSWEETDFAQIHALYGMLRARDGSPLVALNAAVARSRVEGASVALAEIEGLSNELDAHPAFHAARADLLSTLGRPGEARDAWARAAAATRNEAERRFLTARRDASAPQSPALDSLSATAASTRRSRW